MYSVELAKDAANQSLFVQINGHTVYFRFATFRELSYVDIEFDDVQIVGGKRVVSDMKLLPKRFADKIGGQFFFSTVNGVYPTYEMFDGVRAILLFDGEIEEQ